MIARHVAVRPSRAPRRAAVVFGLATATMPLTLPTAQAAPSVDWDRVAQCESGGNWATNTGNGYSGGLQFLPSTWRAYGGTGLPHNASRTQQIAIAENVLDGQGIGAWPVCGPKGLGGSTRNANAEENSNRGGEQRGQERAAERRAPRTSSTTPTTEPEPEPTESSSSPSAESTRESSEASSTESTSSTAGSTDGGSVSTAIPEQRRQQAADTVRVMPGDTLSHIAARNQVPGGWPALHALNAGAVPNPHLILPGQVLRLV